MLSDNLPLTNQFINTDIIYKLSFILNKEDVRKSVYKACTYLILKIVSVYPTIRLSTENYSKVSISYLIFRLKKWCLL